MGNKKIHAKMKSFGEGMNGNKKAATHREKGDGLGLGSALNAQVIVKEGIF